MRCYKGLQAATLQRTLGWNRIEGVTGHPGSYAATNRIEGVTGRTLQRTLGWKEMGGLTKQTANEPNKHAKQGAKR